MGYKNTARKDLIECRLIKFTTHVNDLLKQATIIGKGIFVNNSDRSTLVSLTIKGILPQKIVYRPNLIFRIVMECGKAGFGRRGLKTT